MARLRVTSSDWEQHHESLQRANGEPIEPNPPDINTIEPVAARRGLPREDDLARHTNERHRIEPAAAENLRDWIAEPNTNAVNTVDDEFARDSADEQEIGADAQEETEQAIATGGPDAIAFYAPITFFGPRHYGIYIEQNRFFGFCTIVQKYAPQVPWNDLTSSVFQFLLHHEAYHAAVELSCLVSDDFHERQRARTYRTYFDRTIGPWRFAHRGLFPYRCPEEQLAQHAGLSNMPSDASGQAIRGALIQISQTGPVDYLYDPAGWPGSGKAKKQQSAMEQALHRVQSTSLCRQPPPTSYEDIHPGIEPQAWFPPRASRDALGTRFGLLPIYVIGHHQRVALRFIRAYSYGNIPIKAFIRAVRRKYGVLHDEKGAKHPRLIVGEKKHKVTYPRSARETPKYVIEQVATYLDVPMHDMLAILEL